MVVKLDINIRPQGKARPRFSGGHAYTPKRTREYEQAIRAAWIASGMKAFPPKTPLQVVIALEFTVPKSWTKKDKQAALEGLIHPTCKPDADNAIKAIFDSLNGYCWSDDKDIVEVICLKRYAAQDRILMEVLNID